MDIEYVDINEDFRRINLSGRLDTAGSEAIATRFAVLAASAKRRVLVPATEYHEKGHRFTLDEGLFAFAREHLLLTVSLLHESPLRREEFARHFVAHFGGEFLGETPQDSAVRLRRLDYRTLLGEAEKAKVSAQDRVAHLRRLQEEQEKLLGRRSKF